MYSEVIQSELDAFKANIPSNETVLAEWFLKSLRKGRLIHSHHIGDTYMLLCTDTSLYILKLIQRKIRDFKKHYLLDFTNIQVGYLSKSGDGALDECEVNPGLYAIRLHFGPNEFKTFKHPSSEISDDAQKALIQVIFSQLKATRRELYLSSPRSSQPLAIPLKKNHLSPTQSSSAPNSNFISNNNNNSNSGPSPNSDSNSGPNSAPNSAPNSVPSPLKQDSFMVTLQTHLLHDTHEPVEGVVTITQKHFVFEPSVATHDEDLAESITIPLFKIAECLVLSEEESSEYRLFLMKKNAKIMQMFADGSRLRFVVQTLQAETTRSRLSQWIQVAQDKLAQEIISKTTLQHPLLTREDSTTNFKGDSDILSAKDISYLQYKMPDRHSMDKWEMVYSTTKHGISINTFYTKVNLRAPSVIIVEDTNHHVFGGYASEPWVKTKQVHYGSGESFLFKLKPVSKVFKWSKLNDYYMFSKPDFISFGSGGGGYGLWLDADFEHGSSATSDTYLNEPLSITGEQFKVLRMEVWAPPVFYQKKTSRPQY